MADMLNIDRHIAIQAGWIAGPAFAVAMMAAPEYLHLGPTGSAISFWGGIGVSSDFPPRRTETKSCGWPHRLDGCRGAYLWRWRSLVFLAFERIP
jgi:hypothetical protein